MIPILFSENEQNFTSNGIGRLSEAISCIVTEERNGEYTLSMTYPVSGKWFQELKVSRYIYAVPSDGAAAQPFRIYKISKPLNGRVTISAEHRSYQLSHIPCGPFTASSVDGALQGLKTNAYETCSFDFWTDKTTVANYKQTEPASIRSRLGGVQGSILDVYGGELEFDNLTVKLHANRGTNRGVTLRYGKNITDINQEINIENTITGVCPFAIDQEQNVITLPEHVVYSPNASNFPEPRDAVIDFSSEFENTTPTVEALRAKANAYINANNIGVPSVNIKVSFVALWQTEEYKDIAVLERVKLCDTVTIYFEKLDVEATAKVIKTEYDVLKDRYRSIELGEGRTNLTSQIVGLNTEVKQKANVSALAKAIADATDLISGGLGGHVVFNRNANGEPEEILIMDTDDISTAVNVIRMNQNGIGFSTTGYNGPFTTAWTIDGSFVADFITAGTLRAIDIEGVNITGSQISGTTITSADTGASTTTTISGGIVQAISTGGQVVAFKVSSSLVNRWAGMYAYGMQANNDANGDINIFNPDTLSIQNGSTVYVKLSHSGVYSNNAVTAAGGIRAYGGLQTDLDFICNRNARVDNDLRVVHNFQVDGSKSRIVDTKNYGERLLYCYETPTPYFGDLGEGKTDKSGKCYIFLDDILDESIEGKYQIFLQAYGNGSMYISERTPSYFIVEGEPNTAFGWELKAPQKGYALDRLDVFEPSEAKENGDVLEDIMNYLTGQLYDLEGEVA